MTIFTSFFQKFIKKCSDGIMSIGYVILHSLGIKKFENNYWNYESFLLAIWIFLLGLPVGAIILGTSFSVALWAALIISVLLIVNFDEGMNMIFKIKKYGISTVSNMKV